MAVTIEDIANEAGVSIATVSRVINETKAVSPKLKKRVEEVIEKHSFTPNSLARGLSTSKTRTIGIIVSDISNEVISSVIKGCNMVCEEKGFTVMVCESGNDKNRERELLNHLQNQMVCGVVLCGFDVDKTTIEQINSLDYPVVLATQKASIEDGKLNTVCHDSEKLIKDAIVFLEANGHRKIAFIGGPQDDYYNGYMRLLGFQKSVKKLKLDIPDSYILHGDFSYDSGYNCMKSIYEENIVLPTAVMACSDMMAVGALQCAQDLGLSVPDDISVMGVDDIYVAKYVRPTLSTVHIDYVEEGRLACKELFGHIENEDKKTGDTIYVGHKIIRRGSVKAIKN